MTMVGPTHGGEGLGLGRGGGVYWRRLERDLGIECGPFEGRARRGRGLRAGLCDRTAPPTRPQAGRGRRAGAALLLAALLAGCGGGRGRGRGGRPAPARTPTPLPPGPARRPPRGRRPPA